MRLKLLCLLVGERLVEGGDARTLERAWKDVVGAGGKAKCRIGNVVEEAV